MNYNSEKNQKICSQLVGREVAYCVSHLVGEISKQAEHFPDYEEDLINAHRGLSDYEEPVGWEVGQMTERSDVVDLVEFMAIGKDDLIIPTNADIELLKENTLKLIDDIDGWEEAADFLSVEPHESEILEHWIVSDWFGKQLNAQGERVLTDFFGLTIWGRTCSGQAILLDHVIGSIAEGMDILEGQSNEWKI